MFDRILVYAPREDEEMLALHEASELALRHGASIRVLRVLEESAWWGRGLGRTEGERHRRFLEENQRQLLSELVEPLQESGIEVSVDVRWGTPWLELIQAVLRDRHDLVVKTAEGAARGAGLFFGSTALHLIRKCPCPVWVVGRRSEPGLQRIVAAVDPQSDEPDRLGVAERILNLGAGLAAADGAELHVATAWQAPGESLFAGRVSEAELSQWVESARQEARDGLTRALEKAPEPFPEERVHLLRGDPRRVLPTLIEREDFDLLVLGSHGRAGIAGFLIGETAETLIRTVRCSVLVVKPPHFVCPIEPMAQAA